MCGILGIISPEKKNLNIDYLKSSMNSRGPDDFKMLEQDFNDKYLKFYFSRLSIIDLNERSAQPFIKYNNILLFNGEIYNYLEIKNKLEQKYKFTTSSDTEVLLTAYKEWGIDFVKKLEGMWSFVIFDRNKNEIILSRDRFGEKPLFYYYQNNNLIFGSELKYFKNFFKDKLSLNTNKIVNFNVFGYRTICSNLETFFQEVKYFPKGEIWIFDKDLNIKKKINTGY